MNRRLQPGGVSSSGHGFSHAEKTHPFRWALAPEVRPSAAEAARKRIKFNTLYGTTEGGP